MLPHLPNGLLGRRNGPPGAQLLVHDHLHRLALPVGEVRQRAGLDKFTAVAHQHHRPHIGVGDEPQHAVDDRLVVKAAAIAGDVDGDALQGAGLPRLPGHEGGTVDGIQHQHAVADARRAVLPQIAGKHLIHDRTPLGCPATPG